MNQVTIKSFKPNEERMKFIAEILEIEIEQPFKIQFFNHKSAYKEVWYKLFVKGLMYSYNKNGIYYGKSDALEGLLTGKHQIILE